MSVHVLLNLFMKLGNSDKKRGLPSILSLFMPSILSLFHNELNKCNNTHGTGAQID